MTTNLEGIARQDNEILNANSTPVAHTPSKFNKFLYSDKGVLTALFVTATASIGTGLTVYSLTKSPIAGIVTSLTTLALGYNEGSRLIEKAGDDVSESNYSRFI